MGAKITRRLADSQNFMMSESVSDNCQAVRTFSCFIQGVKGQGRSWSTIFILDFVRDVDLP